MKKLINNRPLFYCFLAFGFGILLAKSIFSLNILCVVLVGIICALITFLCVKYKKLISVALIAACFGLGLLSFFVVDSNFGAKNYGKEKLEITGRVCVSTIYENSQNVIIDNIYLNGEKIGECINVHIYGSTEIDEGTILTFNAELKNNTLFTLGSFNSYNYKYNIHYSCTVNLEDITIDKTDVLNWSERLKLSVKQILFKNMDIDSASVSYASLFGDKTYISSSIKSAFSVSGIAHLLAVSGLHIGFLVSLLTFLLNKLKIKKTTKTAILVIILGLYCYICNFSASVLRACIMFFILNLSSLLGKRYDRLNSWSLAGLICLIIKPLSVYDGGFLLSFGSVLCIFMFHTSVSRLFQKWRIPKGIANTLGVMVPVQFGLIPLLGMFYSKMSLLSILTNFICVPLFEVFFVLLFATVFVVLILPFMAFLIAIPNFLIGIIIAVAGFVSGLDFAIINLTFLGGVMVVAIYVIMFLFSHYINLKINKKLITNLCLIMCASVAMIVQTYQVSPKNNKITVLNSNNSVYFLELNQTSIAIGYFDTHSINLTQNYFNSARLYGADYFISLGSSYTKNTEFKNVYTCTGEKQLNESIFVNNVLIKPIYIGGEFAGVFVETADIKILFVKNETFNNFQCVELGNLYNNLSLLIGGNKNVNALKAYINTNNIIIDGNLFDDTNQTNVNASGNWTFELKNNIITNMRGVD